jgi:hypothetical protein
MLNIRRNDMVELEALYRSMVFQDLAQRPGRTDDLLELIGTSAGEGIYICGFLARCLQFGLDGDVCEFGVAQGATSRLLAREIQNTSKDLWLFDSFEGLPEPTIEDELIDDIFELGDMQSYAGTMKCQRSEVEGRLDSVGFPQNRRRIREGWINKTLATSDVPSRVCFSYVDLDFYEPIRDALQFLHTRTPVGGVIVVDDYGFFSSGAKTAADEFVAEMKGQWDLVMPLEPAGKFCVLIRRHDSLGTKPPAVVSP